MANLEGDETTPTLPLLCIPNRVLFPEETLPMHIYNPHVRHTPTSTLTGWAGQDSELQLLLQNYSELDVKWNLYYRLPRDSLNKGSVLKFRTYL